MKKYNFYVKDNLWYKCEMCFSYLEPVYNQLIELGLKHKKEFVVDLEDNIPGVQGKGSGSPGKLDFGVDWVGGENTPRGTFIFRI